MHVLPCKSLYLTLGILLVLLPLIHANASGLSVATPFGTIIGFAINELLRQFSSQNVSGFLGIPYAAPPVGADRWTSPRLLTLSKPLHATSFGNRCIATDGFPPTPGSEDCLFLNIYVPTSAGAINSSAALPVKFWIHGGAFTFGSGEDYDGAPLAAQTNSIVVTINYRLNIFGFYNDEALVQHENSSLNFGLQDQRAALQWVSTAISSFGGDPSNVMIFGESAGGASVYLLSSWPDASQYFQRAAAESPGPWMFDESSVLQTNPILINGSCKIADPVTRLTCLRSLNSSALLMALSAIQPSPIVDGEIIAYQPMKLLLNKSLASSFFSNHLSFLIGSNLVEGNFFIWDFFNSTKPVSKLTYDMLLDVQIPIAMVPNRTVARTILNSYDPIGDAEGYWYAMSDLFADEFLDCGGNSWANAVASLGLPTFRYRFDHASANWAFTLLNATHMVELAYVWNSPILSTVFDADEQQLSNDIISYWHSFHLYSDPNKANPSLPSWPSYQPNSINAILSFETQRNYQPIAAFNRPQCGQYWEQSLAE